MDGRLSLAELMSFGPLISAENLPLGTREEMAGVDPSETFDGGPPKIEPGRERNSGLR